MNRLNDHREYQRWLEAVNQLAPQGWMCKSGWTFKAPKGTYHDLSCAALDQLETIERSGVFVVGREVPS